MKNEIIKIINKLDGNVLGIGLDASLADKIVANEKIYECNLLECDSNNKEKVKGKTKKIKIKKLKKYFHKKSIDTIICHYEIIKKYMNSFIRNSIYLNKGTLYLFGKIEDIEDIMKRYQRYQVSITKKDFSEQTILIIDNSKGKTNFFKDLYYRIIDGVSRVIIFIGDLLMG